MERVGCFFESKPIEIGEAAKNFDDQLCAACPNWSTCLQINRNGVQREESPKT